MPLDFEKDGIKFHAECGCAKAEKDGKELWRSLDVFKDNPPSEELKSIADFQTSSNMDRFFQLKRSKEQLAKAKEIIKKLKALYLSPVVTKDDVKRQDEILAEVEQFLKAEGCPDCFCEDCAKACGIKKL